LLLARWVRRGGILPAPVAVVSLVGALLAGCAVAPPAARPPEGLRPTACEKRALMTGGPPDVGGVEAVAYELRWGLLAPESCPEAGGRLDGGLAGSSAP
jgi:hypothetical protein